jgi:hypothetical protein
LSRVCLACVFLCLLWPYFDFPVVRRRPALLASPLTLSQIFPIYGTTPLLDLFFIWSASIYFFLHLCMYSFYLLPSSAHDDISQTSRRPILLHFFRWVSFISSVYLQHLLCVKGCTLLVHIDYCLVSVCHSCFHHASLAHRPLFPSDIEEVPDPHPTGYIYIAGRGCSICLILGTLFRPSVLFPD